MFKYLIILLFPIVVYAKTTCMLVYEGEKALLKRGQCERRVSPCSTFKVPISLMGFDSGILQDATHPEWPFKPGYPDWLEKGKHPQNPTTWMQNSCVWYSQLITQKLGMKRFQQYVDAFHYGNQNLSGGLTQAWLESSLKISPQEQIQFLQRMLRHELQLSPKTYEFTKKILYQGKLKNGWKFYGKTGSGHLHGWFVGWAEQGSRKVVFAHLIEDEKPQSEWGGPRAKAAATQELNHVLNR